MSIEKILVIDDELLIRTFLEEALCRKDFEVTTSESGKKGVALAKSGAFDLVITDMKLPDITGLEVLKKIKENSPSTIVIVITAFGSIENAVEAMRLGAFDYLIKPFTTDTIEAIIEKAKGHVALVQENTFLRNEINEEMGKVNDVVAESSVMKKIIDEAKQAAQSNANVFVSGESGTGKEVIAHLIHHFSKRSERPFVKVNCAAVPDTLIESEFFGHEKGAFTGANARRPGRFELASGGSLLLDEITEVPLNMQPKLLRAIQEQEFERVGGTKPVKVDVRLISTSNRSMKEAIETKHLREDLYYRLNVVPLYLPPLRERREDIIPLAEHFLTRFSRDNHKKIKKLTTPAKEKLSNYDWPGNVRELANILERAVVLDSTGSIHPDQLLLGEDFESPNVSEKNDNQLPVGITLQELEKRFIIETLQAQEFNRTKAAERLGISVRTLRNKLHQYKGT